VEEEKTWVVAQVGQKFYATRLENGEWTTDVYDPLDLRRHAARFHLSSMLTETDAKKIVDKLNGPRGPLTRV
jgi:hypothetical protein